MIHQHHQAVTCESNGFQAVPALPAAAACHHSHPLTAWIEVLPIRTNNNIIQPLFPVASPAVHGLAAVPSYKDDMVYVLQNTFIRAVFDSSGRLTSLFDKQWLRELVQPGGLGNRFRYDAFSY
jgi:hypothetical protein